MVSRGLRFICLQGSIRLGFLAVEDFRVWGGAGAGFGVEDSELYVGLLDFGISAQDFGRQLL